jgi:predicted homoserine dehydrogenase-like protein
MIEQYDIAKQENLLPLGLSQGCMLKKNIEKGSPITYKDVELVQDSAILQLRRLQDRMKF